MASSTLLGLGLATPACLVGPDFERPSVALNEAWTAKDDERLAAGASVDPLWWKTLGDPTLDELTEIAYRENLTLQVAGLRILEARAQLGMANADLWPKNVNPIASASAVTASRNAANAGDIDRHYGEFQVGFDAVWELDFWGKYRRDIRAADADYLSLVADYDQAIVSLTAEVARTYVQIRTLQMLIEQAQRNVDLQEEGQRIAESRFKNGSTSELDVAQATNLLESTRASIPRFQSTLAVTQNALSTLLGRPTGFVNAMLADPRGIPKPPAQVAVGVPAELLRRRPDIRAAELRAAAQCERIGVAVADLYPSFSLNGMIGSQVTVGTANAAPLFDPGSLVASVGAGVFWPILNYPKILDNIRVQDARLQQALVTYAHTVLRAAQEVDDGISGFVLTQDAAVFEQNAVDAATNAVELAMVQYKEGAVDYQRVIDTQRVLLASQNNLVGTQSAAVINLIALYKALGGGWELRKGMPVKESTLREMEERTDWGSHFRKLREGEIPEKPHDSAADRATDGE